MSAATRCGGLAAACSARAAFSRRQTCHGPGEERRAAGLELEHRGRHRLEEPAVVRDEDDARRRATAARCSSHSRFSTSRWFVGSSRRSRSGSPASARASEARVSSPPEKVASGRSRSASAKPRPRSDRGGAVAPVVAAGVLEPRLRLGVAAQRRRVVVAGGHRLLERAQLLLESRRGRRAPESTYSRERQAAVERRPLVVQRDPRALLERELAAVRARSRPASMRSSVVLPAPFGPASASRSRRSTLNETPSKRSDAGELLAEVGGDDDGHGQA